MSLRALWGARELYPGFRFTTFLADAAHDAYPIYELCQAWQMEGFIDLNPHTRVNSRLPVPQTVNHEGPPTCPAGLTMVNWGYCPERERIKWRCPAQATKAIGCPLEKPCSSSPYRRAVYTKLAWDFRLFPKTPRGTDAWKKTYAMRTGTERSIKRKANDYAVRQARNRGKKMHLWLLTLAAVNQHLDAWLDQAKHSFDVLAEIGLEPTAYVVKDRFARVPPQQNCKRGVRLSLPFLLTW